MTNLSELLKDQKFLEYCKENMTDEYTIDEYGIYHWVYPNALWVCAKKYCEEFNIEFK